MACYSPSLTVQSGRGQPTFKGGVNASRAHGCHVIHGYHALKFEVPCLRACDYPSMAPVVGQGLPVPKVPKKKSTNGQKNRQSISEDQLDKNPKKKPKNPKEKRPKKEKVDGARILRQSGYTLHSRVVRMA